jgi:hypothetical protein
LVNNCSAGVPGYFENEPISQIKKQKNAHHSIARLRAPLLLALFQIHRMVRKNLSYDTIIHYLHFGFYLPLLCIDKTGKVLN